jgi:hypothetical protein
MIATVLAFGLEFLPATPWEELALAMAAVVTLFGVRLCWQAPNYRMTVEERAKDGELTEDQARRRIRHSRWVGPALVFVGMAGLCGVVLK